MIKDDNDDLMTTKTFFSPKIIFPRDTLRVLVNRHSHSTNQLVNPKIF